MRTPGYPLFLAVVSLASIPAAAAANVILSVFSVILVWKLGRAVFGNNRIALGAAWIFAFEPISVTTSVVLLSDTLFLALFLLSMARLAAFLRGRRLQALAGAGLWLAAATFVRPVTYYLPVALAIGLFFVFARVHGLRWKAPTILLISVLPWIAAWQIRNRVETGYGGFSSISEINLYFYDAAEVTARVEHRNWDDVRKGLGYTRFANHSGQSYLFQPYLALHPEQAEWSQGERLAFMHSEAVHIIRAHFGVYLRSCLASLAGAAFDSGGYLGKVLKPASTGPEASVPHGSLLTEGPVRRWGEFVRKYPRTYLWMLIEKAVFTFAMLGLYLFAARGIFSGSTHIACLWLLLGTSLYFLVVTAAMAGSIPARFRLPVMPFVCIFAAAGLPRTKAFAR